MRPQALPLLLGSLVLLACGDDGAAATATTTPLPYEADRTEIFGDGARRVVVTPDGESCLDLPGDAGDCARPQGTCGDGGRADVVVDAKGKVVAVVCYPVDGAEVEAVPPQAPAGAFSRNKGVVVLDDADDGADIQGDVTIDGNNVVVYGSDPATAIIDGDVRVEKNNGTIHGVTITGDVDVAGNDTALVGCVIHGDVTITSNNDVLVDCTVFGQVTIGGNNNVLYYSRVAGGIADGGKNTSCGGNRLFTDANADGVVDAAEITGEATCAP